MAERKPVDLSRGRVLGNGSEVAPGAVPVQPVEMVLINGQPTPILTAVFLILVDIRDRLNAMSGFDPHDGTEDAGSG